MILVGDTGGTKTRLALYEKNGEKMIRKESEEFASSEYKGLANIINLFLSERKVSVEAACFGVPGPIMNGIAQATNLPWTLKEKDLVKSTSLEKLKLVNDLVATAAAVPYLTSTDLCVLHQGEDAGASKLNKAVLAPGTGLGQAYLTFSDGLFKVYASEGGHADFAPNSDLEIELLKYLQSKFGRVSYERILCGPGLVNIYSFLKHSGYADEPPELTRRMKHEDAAAVISSAGLSGEFEICVKALNIFVSVMGAQAGNLVLTLFASGGVYLGGGIPPKILQKLLDGTILKSYFNKGRLTDLVKKAPLYVIKDDHAALLGAAHLA